MTPDISDYSNEELGPLLKQLRLHARRSPEWMADQLKVNARTIHNWESGRNRASMADVIAYETLTGNTILDLRDRPSRCTADIWVEQPPLFDDSHFFASSEQTRSLALLRKAG